MSRFLLIIWLVLSSTVSYALEIDVQCQDENIRNDAVVFFTQNIQEDNLKKSISNSIKRFYYRWFIENIFVHVDDDKQIQIRIVPDFKISDVKVRGNKQIKKKDIAQQVRVFENVYQGLQIQEELEKYIKDYYAFRGFFQAEVSSDFIQKNRSGNLKVFLNIKENEPCKVDYVRWATIGEHTRERISRTLKKKIKHRCDQELLEKTIKDIEKNYRNKLYRQVDLSTQGFYKNEKTGNVDLAVELQLGIKTDVQFYGNTFAFERDELLRKAIFLDQERKFNQVWIEATAKESIISFYKSKGYPYVEVDVEEQKVENEIRTIKFLIKRGPVMRIRSIKFKGNKKISDKKLRKRFYFYAPTYTQRNVFVEEQIDTVIDRLISYYQSNGFLRASILEPSFVFQKDKNAVDITIAVDEGGKTNFADLEIQGNTLFTKREIRKVIRFKKGSPVNPLLLREQAKELQRDYRERGFKYAKVTIPNIAELETGKVVVPLYVDEGEQITYGDIIFRGNNITQEKVIAREVEFKSGSLYNITDIERTKANLIRLGFFQSIAILEKPRDDRPGTEDVVIQIRERKQRLLVLRPGISTDDGYRFSSSLGYTNIAGTGRSATLSGRINRRVRDADILEHRLIFTYIEPNILNFFDAKLSLISERTDEILFDISRNSLIIGAEKLWSRHFRTTVQWELERRDPFNTDPGVVLSPIDETQARFGSIASIVDIDFRDNILNSERGTFHRIQFDYFDQAFLSDEEFYRISLINNFYIPLYRRIRSILSLRLGYADTLGKTAAAGVDQIPLEKRFRLGGNDSLRGFTRNCVGGLPGDVAENCSSNAFSQAPGGNSLFNYLLEFLFPLNETVDFVLFTDGGNAYLSNGDFDVNDIRRTVGFGLRYNTFVGPLRIDYGIKLDRRTGESFGEIHFAVGQF